MISVLKEELMCSAIWKGQVYFLNGTSATKSFPPLMLSARNTLPVEAIATMCECSLKDLKEMGSYNSPVASFLE